MAILSSVTNFFSGKLRLYLEYLLIATVIALAGWATYQYINGLKLQDKVTQVKADLATANRRVDAVEQVNAQQQEAITAIKGVRSLDSTMLQGLSADMEALGVRDKTIASKLSQLEKSNVQVRSYLESAVPDGVGCVLDDTCKAIGAGDPNENGIAHAASVAPQAVPAPVARAIKNE